jgi:hypothetical protein
MGARGATTYLSSSFTAPNKQPRHIITPTPRRWLDRLELTPRPSDFQRSPLELLDAEARMSRMFDEWVGRLIDRWCVRAWVQ